MDEQAMIIIGAGGQLGTALRQRYPAAQAVDSMHLDITNPEQLAAHDWAGIKIILNAAAYTNVDGAETTEGRTAAWQVNATGTANLARIALEHDLTIVHVSTDYVFDGSQDLHTETEGFSPLGVYGQTKAAADLVVGLIPKHFILRTSWVIGEGKNFVRTMIGLGQKGINPTVVADQIGRLTFTTELVRAIDHLLTSHAAYGTYNVSNSGESASWADITRAIFQEAGYDLTVTDTTTAEYYAGKPEAAPRPLQSTLDLAKLQATGFHPTDWHEDLHNYIIKEAAQ